MAVEPACGRSKRAARRSKEDKRADAAALELFDNYDTEHRSGLDVYQIGKYFQREYRLSLYTNDMRKISSNVCFMLKPDKAFPPRVGHQPLHLLQQPRPPPDEPQQHRQCRLLHPRRLHVQAEEVLHCPRGRQALGLGQREGRRHQREECGKDGIQSKYAENVRFQNGDRKLRHLLMVGSKLIEFAGNFTLGLSKRLMT